MAEDRRLDPARAALRQMRSTAVPVEDGAQVAERRPQLVALLQEEIRAVPVRRVRRERWYRALVAGAAVAASVVLAWGTVRWVTFGEGPPSGPELSRGAEASGAEASGAETSGAETSGAQASGAQLRSWSGEVEVGPPGQEHVLREGEASTALGARSVLSTRGSGRVELELPGAVRVEVNAETQLQVLKAEATSRHLRLARGRIDVQVPKPKDGSGTHLLVSTPDAEVEVRGTVFSVDVRPSRIDPSKLVTDVVVSRGAVAVRRGKTERVVPAGLGWTSERAEASASVDAGVPGAAKPGSRTKAGAEGSRPRPTPTPSSTLAEQNRAFERALAARDRGAWQETVTLCDRFLSRFPDSALVDSVRVERQRALDRMSSASP